MIRYTIHGPDAAPALVLLHGAFLDHRVFAKQVPAFESAHRLIIPDLRCHGLSQPCRNFSVEKAAQDMIALLDAEKIESAIFVGHSLGGLVAQAVIRRAPGRVEALVAVGAPCAAAPRCLAEKAGLALSRVVVRLIPASVLYRAVAKTCGPAPQVVAYAEHAAAGIPKKTCVEIWNGVVAALDPNPSERLDLPVLLVTGEKDRAGTVSKDARYWAHRELRVRRAIVPGAGHVPQLDKPVGFNEIVESFLEEIASCSRHAENR